MLKMALFDSAINAKCWSVAPFSLPSLGDLTAQESLPPGICHPKPKKCLCPRVSPGVGGCWAQLKLTDALVFSNGFFIFF